MVNSIQEFGSLATPQADRLLQHAHRVAEGMGHHVVDSAHVVVALLEQPSVYSSFASTLRSLGLVHTSAHARVKDFFPQMEGRPAIEPYTNAAKEMFRLFATVARKRYESEGKKGRLHITVYDMGAAAIMSNSIVIDRLVNQRGWKPSFM